MLPLKMVHGQKFDIKKYSTNEGLPSGQIGDVVEDTSGYIWLSTYSGLIRYDGYQSKVYGTDKGFRNTLIYDLFVDAGGRLWVSNQEAGVAYLEGDSAFYPPELSKLDSLTVTYITQSEDGLMWFSTYEEGLFIWDGKKFEQLNSSTGLPSDIIWNIHFDNSGNTWIATMKGVAIYDGGSIEVINTENGLSGVAAYSFTDRGNGEIWIATSSGITVFDGNQWNQIKSIHNKTLEYVYDVFADNSGRIWIATEQDGIYWYQDGVYTHINKKNGLSSNYIYNLNPDENGRVWVATDENGVNLFRNKNIRLYNGPEFTSGESVNIIFEGEGYLWLGTENGLTKFCEHGRSSHYSLPDNLANYKEVWDIDKLPNGNLLILNSNSRLFEFDGNRFEDYGKKIGLPYVIIHDVLVVDETLWIATESGLLKFRNGSFSTFSEEDGLASNYVWSLYKDSKDDVWAVTESGISKIRPDSLQTFKQGVGFKKGSFQQITEDDEGNYWVVTEAGFSSMKLTEIDHNPEVINYHLPDYYLQEIQFLQFDKEGNLWIGTNGGIHFFERELLWESDGGEIEGIFMPVQDYGHGIEMNYMASIIDDEGDLWFGSYHYGLVKYEGEKLPFYKKPPKPFLRNFRINGQLINNSNSLNSTFQYNKNNLSIQFGAFNYSDPSRVFYRYRLAGFEENWKTVFGKTEATYTNLPAGDYSFQLQAKSTESHWGDTIEIAVFSIEKPFWKTGWFIILLAVLLLLIIYLVIKFTMVQYQKKRLSKMVDERTIDLQKALDEKEVLIKEVHHRVKNNLAVVSGLLDLQGYKISDKQAKAAIEDSKLRIQTMSSIHEKLYQSDTLTNIDFKGFAEDLIHRISASMQGEGQEIDLHLNIRSAELNINTAIPCGLILNELITNCYEHAFEDRSKGNIWVDFRPYVGNRYRLEVKDDGVGISENVIIEKRSSLGVTLIHSLASQMNGDVEIFNDEGTTVVIKIPSVE
jgi:two-component sensor histidine kinase/ligand-binding sensor domain-containing protein